MQTRELQTACAAAGATLLGGHAALDGDDAVALHFAASSLGDAAFRADYQLKYAYLAGAMYKGIASKELVVALGKAGLMGYFGTGGLALDEVASAIAFVQRELAPQQAYGMNLLSNLERPDLEAHTVDLYLERRVRNVEAAAFMQVTPSVARYRLKGLAVDADGRIRAEHRVLAKVSRPEVAAAFMAPVPDAMLRELRAAGRITQSEAELGARVPVAEDICVEADSAGHTDQGVAYALLPAMLTLRDACMSRHGYEKRIRVGAAGGIGTPQAAAAAFIMGADFILTGSINQCTVEARTSDAAKDMLQEMGVQDTAYAPAGDMFEMGAKVQVLRKGLFFPTRANKLYELYQRYPSLEAIDEKTRSQIQEKYFKRSFDEVWEETRSYYKKVNPQRLAAVDRDARQRMALVFRWYFVHSSRLALEGSADQKVDYQIHCGPALGAFNSWVKGTVLESWRARRVADIAEKLMTETASFMSARVAALRQATILAASSAGPRNAATSIGDRA